jgi:recombinational DNA repair protein RecR
MTEELLEQLVKNSEKASDRLAEIIAEEFKNTSVVEVVIALERLSATITAAFIDSLLENGDKESAEIVSGIYLRSQLAGRKTVEKAWSRHRK